MAYRFNAEEYERRIAEIAEERERRHLAEMDAMKPEFGLCYFIGCDEGLVKIGHSIDVNRRFGQLRATSIYKLKMLATARGGRYREAFYHRKFEAFNFSGEWFERTPEIEAEISRLSTDDDRRV